MRDRLRFTLEEIEDWKHLYHVEEDQNQDNDAHDGVDSGGDIVMSAKDEDN